MPAMQISYVPWQYDEEVIQHALDMTRLHYQYSEIIINLARLWGCSKYHFSLLFMYFLFMSSVAIDTTSIPDRDNRSPHGYKERIVSHWFITLRLQQICEFWDFRSMRFVLTHFGLNTNSIKMSEHNFLVIYR